MTGLPVGPIVDAAHLSSATVTLADPSLLAWAIDNAGAIIIGLWLGASAMWFALQMLRYRHFMLRAMVSAVMLPREGTIELWVSPAINGPVASG